MSASERPLAVVTGASSGIGLELAKVFVEHGFDLVVAAENEVVEYVARELSEGGARVDPVRADLATFEGNEDLVAVVEGVGRPVDALVVNAGVGVGGDFADDSDLRSHLRVVDLNIASAVHLAKRLVPGMVERGAGRCCSPRRWPRRRPDRSTRCTRRQRRSWRRSRRRCGRSCGTAG